VILIEDDLRLRESIAAFLETRGYFTVATDTVEQAIDLLETVRRPCLFLVDPLTIRFDWPRFFASVDRSDRVATLPTVLVSVNAPGLFSKPAVVKKPVDFEILFRLVREHCCGDGGGGKEAGGEEKEVVLQGGSG
jgi:DNA-binding NtrC family response regulator